MCPLAVTGKGIFYIRCNTIDICKAGCVKKQWYRLRVDVIIGKNIMGGLG